MFSGKSRSNIANAICSSFPQTPISSSLIVFFVSIVKARHSLFTASDCLRPSIPRSVKCNKPEVNI